MSVLLVMLATNQSAADMPAYGFIARVAGNNANNISLRQGDRSVSIGSGRALENQRLRGPDLILTVPADNSSKAGVGLVRDVQGEEFSGLLVWAGPVQDGSGQFRLPCRGSNLATLWPTQAGSPGNSTCVPPGMLVENSRLSNVQLHGSEATLFQAAKTLLLGQSPAQNGRYCSSVSNSGRSFGWGSVTTTSGWDLFSADDPCAQADLVCRQAGNGGLCTVMNYGEWAFNDPDVMVAFMCANGQTFYRRGRGTEVGTLLADLETEIQTSPGCILSIYNANSAIVKPATNSATLIQVRDAANGVRINAPLGDVTVHSATHPNGILVEEGYAYVSSTGTREPIDRDTVLNSPDIQELLNSNNWIPLPQTDPPLPATLANQIADHLGETRTATGLEPLLADNSSAFDLTGDWTFDFAFFSFDPSDPVNTCTAAPEFGPYQGQISMTQSGNQVSISAPPEVPMTNGTVTGDRFESTGPSPMRWVGTILPGAGDGGEDIAITGTGICGSTRIPFRLYRPFVP